MRNFITIVENSSPFPMVSFEELYHVGSFKPGDKRSGSYEGAGLSVSLHPDEWREMSDGMVSGDTWVLTKANNHFLDFHSLSEAQRAAILQWGTEHELCDDMTSYSVSYFDDELDDEVTQTFDSREEAEAERDYMEWENEITEHPGDFKSTAALDRAALQTSPAIGRRQVLERLAPLYAGMIGLDGVWWDDHFSPETYSAPRGVIVPEKVQTWTKYKAQ